MSFMKDWGLKSELICTQKEYGVVDKILLNYWGQ
jgi:hypothetical protein